jgi:uncharacterized protein YgbK (DUF1537 family)
MSESASSPLRPLFAWYGDDFTGSTDALEAVAQSGLPAVLFLRTPGEADLRAFRECLAVGIAGESRSRPPSWMRQHLPPVFEILRGTGAPVVQYKICSTFDSSPETGSIGCAIEIGVSVFGNRVVPVVPAAPLLRRYVIFGNLFAAAADGQIYRIDRHPTMSVHPITPMQEGDLRRHLAHQTKLPITGVDVIELRGGATPWPGDAGVALYDGLEPSDSELTARHILEQTASPCTFVVGSSGFTYGLMDHWRSTGSLPKSSESAVPSLPNQKRLLVLAGSCSPNTALQIRSALNQGFHGIHLDPSALDHPGSVHRAVQKLNEGSSVILYSALEPEDRIEVRDRAALGSAMGAILHDVIEQSGVTRVIVAGGDTSSHAAQQLGLTALRYSAPLVRGAPLCRAYGGTGELELVLKGGQIGGANFFRDVLDWS